MATTSRPSDATLAAAAGGGDAQAFAELYERHAGAIYGYCRRVLRSREEAADATHEAFVSVLETIRKAGRPIVAPRPYLFRAAHNACLRIADRGKRFPRGEAPAEVGDHGGLPEPERVVLTRELQDEVREANAALPLRQREILALREVEHLDYQEIAQVMGITPNAAAQLAWRARANMRHRLRRRALTSIELHSLECQRALELLELADDAALSPDEDTWLARHFVACPRCASNRAILAEVGATYRSWVPAGAVPLLTVELLQRAGEVVAASWGTAAGGAGAVAAGGAAAAGGGASGGVAAGGGAAAVATAAGAAGAGTAAVSVPQAVVATAVSLAVAAGGGAAVGGGPAGNERQAGLVAARPAPLVSHLQRRAPAPLPPASRIPLPAVSIPALPKTDAPPLSPEPPAPAVPAALALEPPTALPAPAPEAPAPPLITPAEDRPADDVAAVPPPEFIPAPPARPAPPAQPPSGPPAQVIDEVLDKVRTPLVPAPADEPPAMTVEPAPDPEPQPEPVPPHPEAPDVPEPPAKLPVLELPDAPGRPVDLPDPPAAPRLPDLP